MANIATILVSFRDYVNLEELVKAKVSSFTFAQGKKYLIQFRNSTKVCEKAEKPTDDEGMVIKDNLPFLFVYNGVPLWVAKDEDFFNPIINIAD